MQTLQHNQAGINAVERFTVGELPIHVERNGAWICSCESPEWAERIAACLDACAGIPTALLPGCTKQLVERIKALEARLNRDMLPPDCKGCCATH
jgi:hypothetical protein